MEAEEAWALFTSPREAVRSAAGERVLERSRTEVIEYAGGRLDEGRRLQAYTWGAPSDPPVYLAHGWGGSAAQMALFVDALLERGLRVLSVDTPAHGRSEGARTEIFEFVGVLNEVLERWGPLHGAIGHSLGGAAIAIAARRGLPVGRVALLAATARLSDEVEKFAKRVGLSEAELADLLAYMERRVPGIWAETTLVHAADTVRTPALVIHDEHDREVAYADSELLARVWCGAEFHPTAGLGHVALLRSPDVVQRVTDFVVC